MCGRFWGSLRWRQAQPADPGPGAGARPAHSAHSAPWSGRFFSRTAVCRAAQGRPRACIPCSHRKHKMQTIILKYDTTRAIKKQDAKQEISPYYGTVMPKMEGTVLWILPVCAAPGRYAPQRRRQKKQRGVRPYGRGRRRAGNSSGYWDLDMLTAPAAAGPPCGRPWPPDGRPGGKPAPRRPSARRPRRPCRPGCGRTRSGWAPARRPPSRPPPA